MPIPGQRTLPGTGEYFRPPVDLNARCAFGRLLTPRFFDLPPEIVPSALTTEVSQMIDPDKLRTQLFEGGRQSVDGVLWNADEYVAIVRNPEAFGGAIISQTLRARQLDTNTDRRINASIRSKNHAFEQKQEHMRTMVEFYDQELGWLKVLAKEARTPGWAHMKVKDMLPLATSAWKLSFGNILRAVGEHNEWDTQQVQDAETALTYNLFYEKQKPKKEFWGKMLELGLRYNDVRRRIVNLRLKQTTPTS